MSDPKIVHYILTKDKFRPSISHPVRWLDPELDFELVQQLVGREENDPELLRKDWNDIQRWGYQFCAITDQDMIIAKAAIWRYSAPAWDLAAVAVMNERNYRNGYGKSVCSFIASAILDAGRIATCATAARNLAMQATAESIGFQRIDPAMLPAQYPVLE